MAARTRGLSFEEKRTRMCNLLHEKRDFFQLRDLEKLAPKLKGIVAPSVKEVLESLVADRLVMSEKIGTSNYYWSFPSMAAQSKHQRIQRLEEGIEKLGHAVDDCRSAVDSLVASKRLTDEARAMQTELGELQAENGRIQKLLDAHRDTDPVLFDSRSREVAQLVSEANQWTDAILTLQTYCTTRFSVSKEDFGTQFGIPDDLDYID